MAVEVAVSEAELRVDAMDAGPEVATAEDPVEPEVEPRPVDPEAPEEDEEDAAPRAPELEELVELPDALIVVAEVPDDERAAAVVFEPARPPVEVPREPMDADAADVTPAETPAAEETASPVAADAVEEG